MLETDVLIAGAGPVGLFLANECARRGVAFRIVESKPGQSTHSKALAVFPRTLEVFDMAGVSRPFVDAANVVTNVAFFSEQRRLGSIDFRPPLTPYPYVAMVPQDVTERLLVQTLEARGSSVQYNTTLVAASEGADDVTATLEHNGEREQIRARYVAGCDGAHSALRHILNIPFEGGEYADTFMLADIETNDALPADAMQLCPHASGPLAIFPMSANRRRIVATVDRADGEAPSLALVAETVAERAPAGLEAKSLHWSSYFRIHHRHVTRMSNGRIFLSGDAAHIHSPFGGQGMNTGLQDAWNLAWKLQLAVNGLAADGLLASYSIEREPIVRGVVATTDLMTRVASTRNPLVRAVRNTMMPLVTGLPPFQHAFVQRLSGLANSYAHSPVVEGDGARYFDESMRNGAIGNRFLLFVGTNASSQALEAAQLLRSHLSDILELRTNDGTELNLVRPDGYVAYQSPMCDAASLAAAEHILELNAKSRLFDHARDSQT